MHLAAIRALALTGGDWVIYLLLLCSVVAVATIIERGVLLSREQRDFEDLRKAILAGRGMGVPAVEKAAAGHAGAAARILRTALAHAEAGPEGVEDLLTAASLEERARLEKRLLILGTLGNNAPFVGLFGTVLGVIRAFHDLSASAAGPEVVMRGLSEALIATAVGLFVAIPCVVAYNFLQKRVRDLLSGTESLGRFLLAQVRAAKPAER
ncbi:MAG: MotA/TolQ/ExbB proton channel family protein [Elusimicrobia bacterium]|nr:MotA/TolQ/ExbB proton channel family protein [Elusimicrobiota bacterium]MDE2236482.1 MotA/TolQ/ExbB proton channel family protein [Elusimicrobiota bacterium]MDE2425412.1 MotA/TolQ/ExbB proton channel family protein [Elusimicrobiota bacterium]